MSKSRSVALAAILVLCGSEPGAAQMTPESVERGKKATALVEVSDAQGDATGSAFCVDKFGLFITNAHVVKGASGKQGTVRLVVDCGLATQRILPAKVLRHDDEIDLALLQVNASPGLTSLELAQDAGLVELAEVATFGYPFGRMPAVGRAKYPDITVLPCRITGLRRDKERLAAVQFDSQLNPGNSGGPVLDSSGKVVAVARATVRGAALNLSIPVGRLAEFLATPGLVFEPQPLAYEDRARPVTWTIQVQPPTPVAKLPERLSVAVTIADGAGEPRTYTAQPAGAGVFKATVTPVPRDPDRMVQLQVWDNSPRRFRFHVFVKDDNVTVGSKTFRVSELSYLYGGRSPRVQTWRGDVLSGPIRGLNTAVKVLDQKTVAIDLEQAIEVHVLRTANPPRRVESIEAVVEASQGTKVLARLRRPITLTVAPVAVVRPVPSPVPPRVTRIPFALQNERPLKLGGLLKVEANPRGAGKAIQPPHIAIPPARLKPEATDAPLVRRLDGTISDVAVGGAGRYLFLTLGAIRRLAVFDVNAAAIVKMIPLPSSNALVAAGARKLLIAFPDEGILQRWDLVTLQREGAGHPSPIDGQLRALALGSDSDGPVLALWQPEKTGVISSYPILSFIDLDSLTVLKIGSISYAGSRADGGVSASGGSFLIDDRSRVQVHLRASASGTLFAQWDTNATTSQFRTLQVRGQGIVGIYRGDHYGHLVPGPDGRTIFTALGGRYDAEGKPIDREGSGSGSTDPARPREPVIPSADPAYYLSISGLPPAALDTNRTSSPAEAVTVSVHAARDGSRLLTIYGLDEMAGTFKVEEWFKGDFTTDKRFHFVPAAELLITIPLTNDRLVLRSLKIDPSLDRARGDRLAVTSPTGLSATAGEKLVHQIIAESKAAGITYTLARGPEGLKVAPDGQLTWTVPQGFKEEATAVVIVGDASGAELFHTLKIRVD